MSRSWIWCCHVLLHVIFVWVTTCNGIRCDCDTQECKDAGKTTCMATKFCYTELYKNSLNRGCDPTPLACENRKPSGVGDNVEWPALYCCSNKDLCNKYVIPTVVTPEKISEDVPEDSADAHVTHESNCSNAELHQRTQTTKIINPIYIAVPVAGVCVLLALVIFAMYLLRRRTDYHHHDGFHHYHHDHAAAVTPKKNIVPHHCQCTCKKQTVVPPCTKGNRCTDSERSSSGSETKLFLQS